MHKPLNWDWIGHSPREYFYTGQIMMEKRSEESHNVGQAGVSHSFRLF